MAIEDSLGPWIQRRRKALDMTQQQLAFRVGCAVDTIRKIEAGVRRPSQQIATRLAEALGVPVAERAAFIRSVRARLALPQLVSSALPPFAPRTLMPPSASAHVQTSNLPLPLTNLVGRRHEIDELISLLRSGKRLVTLTGPGGVGKTRLALQIASLLASDYADDVWFADCSSVRDTLQLTNRVAEMLGIAALPEQSVHERLRAWLHDKHLLVVLDNLEQVPDAARPISTWLRYAPGLVLLVTSRVPLDVSGEQEYPVLPLSLPNLQILPSSMAAVQQSDAMVLFAMRVQDIHPHFEITPANQAEVAGICWRLDGLPLAIELAAAWIRLFTPKQLLAQLQGHRILRFLEEKTNKLPPRQQTMYAALAWSYNLLQPPAQTLLSRLAIFGSSWTLDVAELICTDEPGREGQIDQAAIMPLLARLVEHNLVQRVQNESVRPRFTLLETVREFAREQLELRGEAELVHRRHALAYFALAAQARERYDHGDVNAFVSVHEDLDSLRAALAWALEHQMIEAATDAIIRLSPFWFSRMPVALPWLDDILDHADELPPTLRASIFTLIGSLSWELFRDPIHARALCEASLALYRELQDHHGVARVLAGLAHIAVSMEQIDRPQTEAYLAESLALRRMLGDKSGIAETLSAQGRLAALYGDYPSAHALMTEALHIQQGLGVQLGIAVALFYLGWLTFHQGKYVEAARISSERLSLEQAMGNPQGIADCALWLGIAILWQGDPARAKQILESSLHQLRALDDPWHLPHVLDAYAHVAAMLNDFSAAQNYQAERIALLRMIGAQRGVAWSHIHLAWMSMTQANHGEALAYFRSALEVFREKRDPYGPTYLFAVLSPYRDVANFVLLIECGAALAALHQAYEQAMRLCGAAAALRATFIIPFYYPDERDRVTAVVNVAQAALAINDGAVAWEAGRSLSLEQAVAEAFDIPSSFPIR